MLNHSVHIFYVYYLRRSTDKIWTPKGYVLALEYNRKLTLCPTIQDIINK